MKCAHMPTDLLCSSREMLETPKTFQQSWRQPSSLRAEPRIRIVVVGDGRSSAWLKTEVARRQLEDKVILLGRFPLERMPSFFKAADALLVSLRKSRIFAMTIPGKVQSYLAAGLPLLGMLDGEGARVIEEAGAGLVCEAGAGLALAENIVALSKMSQVERRAMGTRGRAYGLAEFDRADLMSRLERIMRTPFERSVP